MCVCERLCVEEQCVEVCVFRFVVLCVGVYERVVCVWKCVCVFACVQVCVCV